MELVTVSKVIVHWSESFNFTDNSELSLKEFERISLITANAVPDNSGYDKTKVTVVFTDGQEYNCRVDLNKQCTGLVSHVRAMKVWRSMENDTKEVEGYNEILKAFELTTQ